MTRILAATAIAAAMLGAPAAFAQQAGHLSKAPVGSIVTKNVIWMGNDYRQTYVVAQDGSLQLMNSVHMERGD